MIETTADRQHRMPADQPQPAAPTAAPNAVDEAAAWDALCNRDGTFDGAFVFAVRTTGVYCRPSCAARRPLRKNVTFHATPRDAEAAGYRPCKRCKPKEMSPAQKAARAVEAACARLDDANALPSLATLAAAAGMSREAFHRAFKAHTGLTPKAYGAAARARRAAAALGGGRAVTEAAFGAGFDSLSAFYDMAARRFAMAPADVRAGGRGEVIVTAQRRAALGVVTAAFSRSGIAAVRLTDGAQEGLGEILALFRHALIVDGGAHFEALMERVIAAIEEPALANELPLDIRGTAFEERVWAALRAIPVGTTMTYGELAAALGAPSAHRAVARACAANRIAGLIPCHRVVRADGSLAGYRWGVDRKAALIAAERAAVAPPRGPLAAAREGAGHG